MFEETPIKVGDRITFRSPTRAYGNAKATRVVTGFWRGEPTVRYHGWGDFIVHNREIIDHHEVQENQAALFAADLSLIIDDEDRVSALLATDKLKAGDKDAE
jgi:hypothetical protein